MINKQIEKLLAIHMLILKIYKTKNYLLSYFQKMQIAIMKLGHRNDCSTNELDCFVVCLKIK